MRKREGGPLRNIKKRMQTPKEINQNKDIQQLTGLAPSQLLILGILVQLEDSHPRSYFVFF
jgi:hypothetical protein